MRLMRRSFIKSAAAGVATLASGSLAWANQRPSAPAGVVARQLYDVSCENFFDWRAYFDSSERALAERCRGLETAANNDALHPRPNHALAGERNP